MAHPIVSSTRWLAAVLIAGALAACDVNLAVPTPERTKPAGPLWEEPQFSKMMAEYQKALPGKRHALVFTIDADSAQLQVQDPAKPENVDAYQCHDGQLQGPIPVRLYGGGKLEDNLFDWDQVAVDRIPALVKTAKEKVPLEGGKVIEVKVRQDEEVHIDLQHGGPPMIQVLRIHVALEGTRRIGALVADAKGNVISAEAL